VKYIASREDVERSLEVLVLTSFVRWLMFTRKRDFTYIIREVSNIQVVPVDVSTPLLYWPEFFILTSPTNCSGKYIDSAIDSLTPWSKGLLEKLIVCQLVKEFSAFYGTRRFITVFTRASLWTLSRTTWIHSKFPHPVSLRFILNYPPIYAYVFQVVCSGFPTKYCVHFSSPPCVLHNLQYHPLDLIHPKRSVQVTKLIAQSSRASWHFLSLRSRYSPQRPVFLSLEYVFFFFCIYEGHLQSSWTLLITPSRNFVEVRWRSLFRSTSLGKRS
jgi:hypothetical protein